MKTIALRFGENFAPVEGTIAAHQAVIDQYGFVYYGKLGSPVGMQKIAVIMNNEHPRILLIQSGKTGRWWAYVVKIQRDAPDSKYIPAYYRDDADKFKTWFKITRIDEAPSDIMSHCTVVSSNAVLSHASHYSMSPYFFIEAPDEKEDA